MGDFLIGVIAGYKLFSVAFTTAISIVSIWLILRGAKIRIEYPPAPEERKAL